MAVGLRTAAGGSVTGIEETSVRALAKLERLRFDYRRHDGKATRRDVEPHRLVHGGRRCYLVAWDVDRRDWRTFRADRIEPKTPTGPRFEPRETPEGDVADFVSRRSEPRHGHTALASECRALAQRYARAAPT